MYRTYVWYAPAVTLSRTAVVLQAYRYALDPTPRQRGALASHTGASRFAYNWGLQRVRQRMEAKAAGSDIQVPWRLYELRREWNKAKHEAGSVVG